MNSSDNGVSIGRGCCLVFVVLAIFVGTTVLGYYRFSPPSIVVTQHVDHVELRNRYLEYWIGLSEVRILKQGESTPLIWAIRRSGSHADNFAIYSGEQGKTVARNEYWDFKGDGVSAIFLEPGEIYEIRVWGNNGFGFFNEVDVSVELPVPKNNDTSSADEGE